MNWSVYMCMHEIYIYICAYAPYVCMYVYTCSCICTHKPGPQIRNGVHQMPVLVCGLLSLSVSLSLASFHVFVTQWLLPATYWSFAIHMLVRCVCVQIVDAIYVYVCVLCSCMVVVYFTQLLQGLPRLLYVYRLIYKYIHVRVHTDSAQQTHKHVES